MTEPISDSALDVLREVNSTESLTILGWRGLVALIARLDAAEADLDVDRCTSK